MSELSAVDTEILIVGGGITGIHMLYRAKKAGFAVRLLEAGTGVGGTWFWNRYPGARLDSESYTYGYFFDKELREKWEWSEQFAAQPELERYLNHAVDRFQLRDDITFSCRVIGAVFDDDENLWTVSTDTGLTLRTRFLVTATGILSVPYIPDLPGREDYRGEQYHTGDWPSESPDFRGKRVAVFGAGSSGVQIVPEIARDAATLTVYQRTANWVTPLNNQSISPEGWREIMTDFDGLHRTCQSTYGGFRHADATQATFDHSEQERRDHYERMWNAPGFMKLFSNYADLMVSQEANDAFCAFLSEKIRALVDDPATAEKLIPKDHGFGMKRPPMGAGYFEAFNLPHVSLVDLRETPVVKLTESGIETTDGEREFDIVVWATGFDAVTGALTRMGIQGSDGTTLKDFWEDGPRTYLGLQSPGFPNLFIVGGPHSTFGNIPRSTETHVDFVADLLEYVAERGINRVEPEPDAEEAWTAHAYEAAAPVLTASTSWYVGSNIPGKARRFLVYAGGVHNYREKVEQVAANGYEGFRLTEHAEVVTG